MTGSLPQLINGICLITTFFSCRLVWGSYMTIIVFSDVWKALNYEPSSSSSIIAEKYLYNQSTIYSYSNITDSNDAAAAATATGMRSPADAEVMRFTPMSNGSPQLNLHVPFWLAASYLASNVVLHGLNVFWFGRMIETIRKRFDPPFGTRGKAKGEKSKKEGKEEGKVAVMSAADNLTAAEEPGNASFATGTGMDGGTSGTAGKRTRRRAY